MAETPKSVTVKVKVPDIGKISPRIRYGVLTKNLSTGDLRQCTGDGMPVGGVLTQEHAQDWADHAVRAEAEPIVVCMVTLFVEV